ncbi:MAG TPA: penicillin-binding protein 1A [Steroidobacteraceae bacterium]
MKIDTFRLIAGSLWVCLVVAFAGVYALVASYMYLEPSLPSIDAMASNALPVPLRIYTRSGQLIAQIGEKRRVLVSYDDIPPLVREAFVSAEDQRFYTHHGFDYSGMLRAVWVDLTSGKYSQGASTITMQAARNMFLTLDKSIKRKLQEIFVAYRMEHEFTKEQILQTYLNVIFLGQRSYGVAAAAETYFGKPLDQLSVAEAATLAGLPQAPSNYNPVTNPKAAQARRRYVLQQMVKLKYIGADAAQQASQEPVTAHDYGILTDVEAPYVAEMARADLVSRFGDNAVNAGYKVYTTIDGRLQTAANRAVRIGLIQYDRRHGYRGPLKQVNIDQRAVNSRLDATLADVSEVGNLHAALVVSVAPQSARVYIRSMGFAQIDWEGLSWARRRLSETRVGSAPKHAEDVLQRGDVVYVVTNGEGVAQLAQLPEAQSALVALDPNDGALVSLVGGFDYFANKFNRATQAKRQPGSGFKPFLYSAALENGFTPSTIVMDAPIVYDDSGQEKTWRPENNEKGFDGPMRLREGLVFSRNLVTIRVVRQLGVDTAIAYAAKFGFNPDDMPRDMTIALGSLPATPLQMASGYAVFANGGYRVDPYFIERIDNAAGQTVFQANPKVVCEQCDAPASGDTAPAGAAGGRLIDTSTSTAATPVPAAADGDPDHKPAVTLPPLFAPAQLAPRVISPQNDWLMDDMMADVIKRGTGIRAGMALHRNDISGKTGTTNDARDTWFNGFNRNIVATVWVGFDQERPLGEGEEGSRTAVPIWVDFMREALRDQPDRVRPLPPGLVTARISPKTGLLAAANDSDAIYETFMEDHMPTASNASTTLPGTTPQTPGSPSEPLF